MIIRDNIISKINTINYKITLNEEKLNIYIKKLNDSNNLNDEYQQDILELEKTNINNKTQIDFELFKYYMTTWFSFDELSVMERNKKLSIFCLIIR